MEAKTCLVTGGTGGIGRAAAQELARLGATVVLVGRNAERGAAAVAQISAATGNPRIAFLAADLSTRAGVRAVAAAVTAAHPRLHVLVNNAGALYAHRRESADGIEMTLALNHLAPFRLTNALLAPLHAAGDARIVNVSSEAHRDVKALDFADLQATRRGFGGYPRGEFASAFYALVLPMAHPGFLQYARSKLATQLFTAELARRLAGSGITANTVNPGVVASDFGGGNGLYGWFIQRFFQRRGVAAEVAAQRLVHVATAPELAGVSGEYFSDNRATPPAPAALDPAAAARLWDVSETLAGG